MDDFWKGLLLAGFLGLLLWAIGIAIFVLL